MGTWADATLTTTTTLQNHEYEINNLAQVANIAGKIVLAKALLKNKIEKMIRDMGNDYTVDYDSGEELIDVVANPTRFTNACDYKCLELIYRDLCTGNLESMYGQKATMYEEMYVREFDVAASAIDYDWNQDGTTDEYQKKAYVVGRVSR